MTLQDMREEVDRVIYEYVKAQGLDPDDFDYSQFNDLLDNLE